LSAVDAVSFLEIESMERNRTMTIEDLIAVLMDIIPDAQLGEDEDGQIVIYTGLKMPSDGRVMEMRENGA
jgi:hypothetical protein